MHAKSLRILLPMCALLCACSRSDPEQAEPPARDAITGTITAGSPVSFTDGTRLELRLTDVSNSDLAPVLASKSTAVQQLPYAYQLAYPAGQIDATHRYTIEVRIYTGESLRYATDTPHPVLTQGHGAQRDVLVNSVGVAAAAIPVNESANETLVHGELRTSGSVTLYRANLEQGSIRWLEEERSNNTPEPLRARYEFKGALLQHYRDNHGMAIQFDARGRPQHMQRDNTTLALRQESATLDAVRNRAELLRSHALAQRERSAHRLATENWQGQSGLTRFGQSASSGHSGGQ